MDDLENDFKAELSAALKENGLSDEQPSDSKVLLEEIRESFVVGNPRAWWLGFKKKPTIINWDDDDGYLHLAELAPSSTGDVWFIADENNEEKLIFNVPIQMIKEIIKACRYFEYYVVSPDLSWMLAENDHGEVLFTTRF